LKQTKEEQAKELGEYLYWRMVTEALEKKKKSKGCVDGKGDT